MSSPTPTPSAGSSPTAPVPTNADGSPNFGSLGQSAGSGGSVPLDSSGAIDVWDLPSWVLDYEKTNKNPFYWADAATTKTAAEFNNRQFRQANDMPQSDADANSEASSQQYVSAETLMKQFSAMRYTDPTAFLSLQKTLAEGPWLSSMKITGSWDKDTEKALGYAMEQYLKTSRAAGVPVSFSQFLTDAAKSNQELNPGGGTGGSAPSRPELTDPDTLSMYAQRAAQAALGRNLSPSEVNAFISSFHNEQTSAYNQALHGQGAVVDKNDPRASAIQFVTGQHAQEFDQHQAQGYMDSFLNMFLSGSSSAPNTNVDPSAVAY